MRLQAVIDALRALAPEELAESWDRVGLQLGDPAQDVRRALLCIDLTPAVAAEAAALRASLVVAYHPVIFEPLPALTASDARQAMLVGLIRRGVAVYCPHTALDAAAGGMNAWLAAAAGEGEVHPIRLALAGNRSRYTLVTFVPFEQADALRAALAREGAGQIGNYTECSFNLEGFGTFRAGASARPTVGRAGRFERAPELRLEMVCPGDRVTQVVAALRRAHPYETPAFDLYRVEAEPAVSGEGGVGQGRVVTLAHPTSLATLVQRVKRRLRVARLEVAAVIPACPLTRIGFCAGAGGSLLPDAGPLDAFVTGEMRHHDVLAAVGRGTAVLLAGHTQTERPYLPEYRRRIRGTAAGKVDWIISRQDRPPTRWA